MAIYITTEKHQSPFKIDFYQVIPYDFKDVVTSIVLTDIHLANTRNSFPELFTCLLHYDPFGREPEIAILYNVEAKEILFHFHQWWLKM